MSEVASRLGLYIRQEYFYGKKNIDNVDWSRKTEFTRIYDRGTERSSVIHSSLLIPHSSFHIHSGLIVTGDWFVDSREKMREIIGHFPDAKAVDMESCAIAQTCYINKVPFISFRVISDIPLRDTDASQYHNFWETIAENSFQVTRTFVESL